MRAEMEYLRTMENQGELEKCRYKWILRRMRNRLVQRNPHMSIADYDFLDEHFTGWRTNDKGEVAFDDLVSEVKSALDRECASGPKVVVEYPVALDKPLRERASRNEERVDCSSWVKGKVDRVLKNPAAHRNLVFQLRKYVRARWFDEWHKVDETWPLLRGVLDVREPRREKCTQRLDERYAKSAVVLVGKLAQLEYALADADVCRTAAWIRAWRTKQYPRLAKVLKASLAKGWRYGPLPKAEQSAFEYCACAHYHVWRVLERSIARRHFADNHELNAELVAVARAELHGEKHVDVSPSLKHSVLVCYVTHDASVSLHAYHLLDRVCPGWRIVTAEQLDAWRKASMRKPWSKVNELDRVDAAIRVWVEGRGRYTALVHEIVTRVVKWYAPAVPHALYNRWATRSVESVPNDDDYHRQFVLRATEVVGQVCRYTVFDSNVCPSRPTRAVRHATKRRWFQDAWREWIAGLDRDYPNWRSRETFSASTIETDAPRLDRIRGRAQLVRSRMISDEQCDPNDAQCIHAWKTYPQYAPLFAAGSASSVWDLSAVRDALVAQN